MASKVNMLGTQYGKLTVIKEIRKASNNDTIWLCKCTCGKETEVFGGNLRRKDRGTKSCGECLRFVPNVHKSTQYGIKGHAFKDLTGKIFGRLTVLTLAGYKKDRKYVWTCLCSCGTKKDIVTNVLQDGRVVSCGCYWLEQISIEPGQAEINSLLLDYKNGAIGRNYSFTITKSQFESIIKQDCYYCGCKPSKFKQNGKSSKGIYFNGIDRVDNSKGYDINNCVSCCYICNRAKATMSHKDFLDWIKRCFEFSVAKKLKPY